MSVRLVPKFLKAPNEKAAMFAMLRYQIANKRQCNAISIYENKEGGVTIWFYDEISNDDITREIKLKDAATKPVPR